MTAARAVGRRLTGRHRRCTDPGLVVVQIDGLSGVQLQHAVAAGRMPFVRRLLHDEGYRLVPLYSGLPSTTPAVQAELFYGIAGAVPAFSFAEHDTGRIMRMWQRDAVCAVERRLGERPSMVAGGASYGNIYAGGARRARFCMACLRWADVSRSLRPAALGRAVAGHAPDVAGAAARIAWELARSAVDLARRRGQGGRLGAEIRFASAGAVVDVLLREVISVAAKADIARGLPVVHLNFVGYDEYAHHRGPASDQAQRPLRGIDHALSRLARAARRSDGRTYAVWVMSDHGQTAARRYLAVHGRPLHAAVAEVVAAFGLQLQDLDGAPRDVTGQRARRRLERLVRFLVPALQAGDGPRDPDRVVLIAEGSLGHLYTPRRLAEPERGALAAALVEGAGVPVVLAADGTGRARAWSAAGEAVIPDEAAQVLGTDHPYLDAVARDLVALCHHPDAGDLVLSGWRAGAAALTFKDERGTHGGPGPLETDAFVLAPAGALGSAPIGGAGGGPLRPADVRRAAMRFLAGRSPLVRVGPDR